MMSVYFYKDVNLVTWGLVICLAMSCWSSQADNEPPVNAYLADSPWPMSHRNPYNQASSPLRGVEPNDMTRITWKAAWPSITLAYSPASDDASDNVVWGSTFKSIYQMDLSSRWMNKLDSKPLEQPENGISGAYTLVDVEGKFFSPRGLTLSRFSRAEGENTSTIVTEDSFVIPDEYVTTDDEHIVGINMTYDGHIAMATSAGLLVVVDRDFSFHTALSTGVEQSVSNSIAVDEEGGIYVLTNKQIHRVQWDGTHLERLWSTDYESGPEAPLPGRLGTGSGSTPSLMGKQGEDQFVVFTDGAELMNLVLVWRDKIPEDWEPIREGKDRRIAAEFPITFGIEDATRSISEQSVLVRGHSAMVVDNQYSLDTSKWLDGANSGAITVLFSNLAFNAPYGVEKFSWNAQSRQIESEWSNQESCPNGIPTMSEMSNIAYCWGQRNAKWTLLGFDWDSGETVVDVPMGYGVRFNSTYAATQIGYDAQVISGTLLGLVRIEQE
ncbi:hypothetical protein [Shewanella surugensis]|uniref:Uncharacterized protein n=1 Tax=Shewanella surugensis TaxID=212020 RepID=A0ABT0LE78_9GAMM|nr:hypothetical protein [Shewanella surugensis]MCL1125960.1 hypothetical protein [Shewanella surugensis]